MSLVWRQVSALLWKSWIQTKRSSGWFSFKALLSNSILISAVLTTISLFAVTAVVRDRFLLVTLLEFFMISIPFIMLMEEVVSRVMLEKISKIREHFRIQGVGEVQYAFSYLLHYCRIATLWLIFPLITALIKMEQLKLLDIANDCPMVVIIYFFALISAAAAAYAQCAFFDDSKIARFFVTFAWLTPALPVVTTYIVRFNGVQTTSDFEDILESVALVMQYLHPAGFIAYNTSPLYESGIGYFPVRLFLIPFFQIPVYLSLGMYLHQVIKSKHGSSRPWDFFLNKSVKATPAPVTPTAVDPTRFESTDTQRPVGVVIEKVVKEFDGGSVVAVADLSLSVYESEIFALLGHNGAGKTTLLECLVGIQSVTHGRIIVNGFDISENPTEARASVGICPQFDAFYDNFKPLEMLELYGRLRGQHPAQAHSIAEMMLERMGLLKKMHSMAKDLSGGQKRKLSVGLAFTGNTKTVILDEPSSGMDIESSLELWSVIRTLRPGRTIIMTTHNMSEAEALGDRIGIMSAGSMQCLGSPMFLKHNRGSGYLISFKLADHSDIDISKVKDLVNNVVPNAKLLPLHSGHDLSVQIPNEDVPLMTKLLNEIEAQKSDLKIQHYALAPSRLEDVFLSITKAHEEQLCKNLDIQKSLPSYTPVPVSLGTHFISILILIWHYFRSDIGHHLSMFFPISLSVIFWSLDMDLMYLAIALSCYVCAPHACSNLSHFTQSDIRLQLDIFGMNSFVYWATIIAFNLLQTAIPFAIIMSIWHFSDQPILVQYSPSTVSALVFALVGFMACIRSASNSISPFKAAWVPVVILFVGPAFFIRHLPFLRYVVQACQIHPIILFLVRSFDTDEIPQSTLIILFIVMGVIYFAVAIVAEYHRLHPNRLASFSSPLTGLETGRVSDEDVLLESNRIKSGANDVLQVVDLAKSYNKTVAVRGINVGVPGGQSLAFLGINGSGKTSSIQCMLGISAPSRGYVKVAGINVNEDESAARQHIGYVPQHDKILIGKMSGRQQLTFFARLAGVPEDIRSELVDNMLFNVGLDKAADRRSETYSGGMKRKLCVALALMIKRNVVLLDEPSTGVDPASRRRFWAMFAEIQADPSRCLLLTTHQLDEAEAVCDRISIMVNGEIVCLGSASHLSRKFGNHYQIDLNATAREHVGEIRNWFSNQYPRSFLVEADGTHLRFWIPKAQVQSLASLFAFVHEHGRDIPVQDAIVGEATLEQIFLSIAYKSKHDPNAHFVQLYNPL